MPQNEPFFPKNRAICPKFRDFKPLFTKIRDFKKKSVILRSLFFKKRDLTMFIFLVKPMLQQYRSCKLHPENCVSEILGVNIYILVVTAVDGLFLLNNLLFL